MRVGAWVLFVVAGCGGGATPWREVTVSAEAVTAVVRATPTVRVAAGRCETFAWVHPERERRFCSVSARGLLWAVEVDADDAALVAHEDAAGKRVSVRLAPDAGQGAPSDKGEESAVVFDFDGDGDPELFFPLIVSGYEIRVVRGVFLTVKDDRIVPYGEAPAGTIELRDIDEDGRPDAIVRVEGGGYKGCNYCAESSVVETFVAHSRTDGTFSLTDDVARGFVRERCPMPPSGQLVKNDDIALDAIYCARIWGEPQGALVHRIGVECASEAARAARCEGPCRYRKLFEMAAAVEPLTSL